MQQHVMEPTSYSCCKELSNTDTFQSWPWTVPPRLCKVQIKVARIWRKLREALNYSHKWKPEMGIDLDILPAKLKSCTVVIPIFHSVISISMLWKAQWRITLYFDVKYWLCKNDVLGNYFETYEFWSRRNIWFTWPVLVRGWLPNIEWYHVLLQ